MSLNGKKGLNTKVWESHKNFGRETNAQINIPSHSTVNLSITGEVFTVAAGAAGTTGNTKLAYAPVYDSNGTDIGNESDSSVSFTTGTVLTTEIKYREDLTDAEQYALMDNGDYAINYHTGKVRYKKATTATSDVVAYSARHTGTIITGVADDVSIGSSGVAGGGNNTYSTEQGDFTATVTNATYSIVLSTDSIGGVSITENNFSNGLLKVYDASTEEMVSIKLDDFTWTSATKTLDVTNCSNAFLFATGDVVSLTLVGSDKMRDTSTDAQRSSLIRDISDQYTSDSFVLTNVPNATPDETTIVSMDGYKGCSIHIEKTGGTDTFAATIEASNEGTLSTDDWIDITQYGFSNAGGADAASYTADTILFSNPNFVTKGIKVKITTADANDDADFNIFIKRWY